MFLSSVRIFLTLAVRMLCEHLVLLEDFAADIERQVFAVDDAAYEAQVLRQKLFSVVEDEDALHVKLDASLVLGLVEVERCARGDEEQRGVVETAFGLGMEPEERIFPITGEGFVEFLVVLVLEFRLGTAPGSARGIHLFGGAGRDGLLLRFVPLALVVGEEDREGDVVGVFLDDLLQAPAIGVLGAFLIEMQEDCSAGDGALGGFDVEAGRCRRWSSAKQVLRQLCGTPLPRGRPP